MSAEQAEQLSIDQLPSPEPRELARTTDPDTSHAAAASLDAGRAGTMRRKLLDAYGERHEALTAEEAAERAGYTKADGAWKRVSDLIRSGLVRDTGERRPGTSGRDQRVLRITDVGLKVWARGHR